MAMHMLARLIEDVRAAQGWNQSELARRAGMSRGRISQLIKDPVKRVPSRATIDRLARALAVPPWVVMDAILETLDLPTRPARISIEEAVRADSSLSAGDKRGIMAFLEHMRGQEPRPDLSTAKDMRVVVEESANGLRLVEENRRDT